MAFWPDYDSRFTKTPNIFYDSIIFNESTKFNEVKLIAYLIRNTLGYNEEAAWVGVTRKDLITKAKISNGSIHPTIKSCKEKGWILEYVCGESGKEERYIFLNDPLNERIVKGLEAGYFTVSDLEDLNKNGIHKLLKKHGLLGKNDTPPKIVEDQMFPPPKIVEGTPPKIVEGTPPKIVEGNNSSTQEYQGNPSPLKTTSFKDIFLKDNVVVELFRRYMNVEITEEEAQLIVNESANYQKDVEQAIQETVKWAEINEEELTNPIGSVIYAMQRGWNLNKQTYKPKTKAAKQGGQRKPEKKPVDQEKMPMALRMAQEQPQQPANQENMEEKQRQIQEKLKEMNERFNQRKKREREPAY